jgi:transposase-like protein
MMIALVLGVILAVVLVLAAVFALERKRCPSCSKRRVALKFWESSRQGDLYVGHYQCRSCDVEWRSYDGRVLLSLEAYHAGARDQLPAAFAREGKR